MKKDWGTKLHLQQIPGFGWGIMWLKNELSKQKLQIKLNNKISTNLVYLCIISTKILNGISFFYFPPENTL